MRIAVRIAITIAYLILAVPIWAVIAILTMPDFIKLIWRGKKKAEPPKENPIDDMFKRALADAIEKKAQQQAMNDTAAGKPTRADWNKLVIMDWRRGGNC